jgi:hypothetical protein
MGRYIDRSGEKFGRLTVLGDTGNRSKSGSVVWLCRCICGNEARVSGTLLSTGQTRSCGCLFLDVAAKKGRDKKTHGMSGFTEYRTWTGMKHRCFSENDKKWHSYGGQGITVSNDWLSFLKFYEDMGPKPEGMSLDRIDTNGDYCKENCRWATQKTQQNNRRNNKMLIVNGETLTMQMASEKYGIDSNKVQRRIAAGWPVDQALGITNRRK